MKIVKLKKKKLKPTKPPLELANVKKSFVNKYSFVQIENNFYSVPEYLVGLNVTSKIYYNKILITNSGNLVENTRYNNSINNLARVQTCMYNQIMIGVVNK